MIASGDIGKGQNVWQAMGGMEVGSIWGHGSYVAPDWSADWLHREATGVLDTWAQRETGKRYSDLDAATTAAALCADGDTIVAQSPLFPSSPAWCARMLRPKSSAASG